MSVPPFPRQLQALTCRLVGAAAEASLHQTAGERMHGAQGSSAHSSLGPRRPSTRSTGGSRRRPRLAAMPVGSGSAQLTALHSSGPQATFRQNSGSKGSSRVVAGGPSSRSSKAAGGASSRSSARHPVVVTATTRSSLVIPEPPHLRLETAVQQATMPGRNRAGHLAAAVRLALMPGSRSRSRSPHLPGVATTAAAPA